jgi:hypothetical protein
VFRNSKLMVAVVCGVRDWVAEPGEFEVWVGSSSKDIRRKGSFEVAR